MPTIDAKCLELGSKPDASDGSRRSMLAHYLNQEVRK
jgi:hypothetical protein